MEHAREIELVELAAGRLDAQREQTILAHVRQCSQCREKLDGLRRTWEVLGAWEVWPPEHLAPPEALLTAGHGKRDLSRPVVHLFGVRMALRFAAAILIATAAGYAGGRWTGRRASPVGGIEPPRYVSALGLDIGESLSSLVLRDESLSVEDR
ncbi:MAG: hypothetical protein KBE65_00015 [Phycisphaerae bacterium]|nr:hypothetical protein [Phycisphaerae bacterium]